MCIFKRKNNNSNAEKLKIGIIGLGNRGKGLLAGVILGLKDIEVVAVCDLYQDRADFAANLVMLKQHKKPKIVTTDYKEVLADKDIKAIVISTAWEAHIEIAIEAMKVGIIPGMEVGGAYSVQDCYKIVEVSEQTGVPCMLLENCCYGKYELCALHMARLGLFGDIVYLEGGYIHDLRNEIAFGKENRHYRLHNYLNRNCENYPTHEIGPIAKIVGINKGNRFVSLVSMSSKSVGMHEYIVNKKKNDNELINAEFKQGDVVTTMIKCENGETITIRLDTTLPHPYSRNFTVEGTKGVYREDGNYFYLDGKPLMFEAQSLLWNNAKRIERKYRHPLWKEFMRSGVTGGHGGMDYLVLRAFFDAVKTGSPMPIDVYDLATYMAITPLSEQSIKEGGTLQQFPDFTNGAYKTRKEDQNSVFYIK